MSERWDPALVLSDFGGEYTLPGSQQAVPANRSSLVRNCLLYPGRLIRRPGWSEFFNLSTFQPQSIGSYYSGVSGSLSPLLIFVGTDGTLRQINIVNSMSTIAAAYDLWRSVGLGTLRMRSVTQFGRFFMGFTNTGYSGYAKPLVYDGANLMPVAPCGPGESGSVADSAAAGSISAGPHSMRVIFTTKYEYLTAPGPAVSWTAAGAKKGTVTNIPTGPSYVDGRILCFTAANDTDYYYIAGSSMVIDDNTTTTATVDFSDTQLLAGVGVSVASDPDSDLLRQIELPAMAGVAAYHNRLCWFGQRDCLPLQGDVGFRNLSFNGGWSGNRPLGWTEKIAGESKGTGLTGANGDYLKITGNGAGVQGLLANKGLAANIGGVSLSTSADNRAGFIPPNKTVNYTIRIRKDAGLVAGRLYIYLANTTDANNFLPASFGSIDQVNLSATEWWDVTGTLHTGYAGDSTKELRICAGKPDTGANLFTNGQGMYIDYIEVAYADSTDDLNLVRWSKADQPDSYDGLKGFQYVGDPDGYGITAAFELNDSMYFVKPFAMYSTRDDGSSEPGSWGVQMVSRTVGAWSQDAIAYGDQWVAIAANDGLYYFDGGKPICISNHIRPTWQNASNFKTLVDMDRKLILVNCAMPGDTGFPRSIMCFQWYGQSPITEELRYGLWTLPASSNVVQLFRNPHTRDVLMTGTNMGNRILKLDESSYNDWTNVITQQYRTPFFGDAKARRLFKGLSLSLEGAGTLNISTVFADESTTVTHPALTMPSSKLRDQWYPFLRHHADRFAVDFTMNAGLTGHFALEKIAALVAEDPILAEKGRR